MPSTKSTGVGLGISFPVLATLTFGLRLHVRRYKKAALGVDDYAILASLVCLPLGFTS